MTDKTKYKFVLKLSAILLLACILTDFACDFFISIHELSPSDQHTISIGNGNKHTSTLFLISRNTEEENESHRFSPQHLTFHHVFLDLVAAWQNSRLANLSFTTPLFNHAKGNDLIIRHHRLII